MLIILRLEEVREFYVCEVRKRKEKIKFWTSFWDGAYEKHSPESKWISQWRNEKYMMSEHSHWMLNGEKKMKRLLNCITWNRGIWESRSQAKMECIVTEISSSYISTQVHNNWSVMCSTLAAPAAFAMHFRCRRNVYWKQHISRENLLTEKWHCRMWRAREECAMYIFCNFTLNTFSIF